MNSLLMQIARCAAAIPLGIAPLWWLADHAGPSDGTAVVHVVEPDVEVTVGDIRYRIERRSYQPIVCELPAGSHVLEMRRGAEVLHRETFEVERGGSIVLTAWRSSGAVEGAPNPGPSVDDLAP